MGTDSNPKVSFYTSGLNVEALFTQAEPLLSPITPPVFEQYHEDIPALYTALAEYTKYNNILLIGNGGSIWSFLAYHTALCDGASSKHVVAITDMEPSYLAQIKAHYKKEDSIVVIVSKSGSTVGVIEDIFAFAEYPKIFVTDPSGPLAQIGQYYKSLIIPHPSVGGRYSGFTSSAYVPAILAGLPVNEIEAGARAAYQTYSKLEVANPALSTALLLKSLEDNGYDEIFMPIYSNFLQTFGMVVTQLIHESFGKGGQGLTVVAAQAPESHHHTNQRFFGGPKNMVGLFVHVAKDPDSALTIHIPPELQNVPLRTGKLADIDGINLADSFVAEYVGSFTYAKEQGIPLIDLEIPEVSGKSVGALLAFWHYVTVYSSLIRGVDPYDQPQVEASKVISFEERIKAK